MRIVVCENATIHADGTYSITRGGIDRSTDPKLPLTLGIVIFLEAPIEELPPGRHQVDIDVTAPNGHGGGGAGEAVVPPGADVFRGAFPLQIQIDALGIVMIRVRVGTAEATATITFGAAPQRPGVGTGD